METKYVVEYRGKVYKLYLLNGEVQFITWTRDSDGKAMHLRPGSKAWKTVVALAGE